MRSSQNKRHSGQFTGGPPKFAALDLRKRPQCIALTGLMMVLREYELAGILASNYPIRPDSIHLYPAVLESRSDGGANL